MPAQDLGDLCLLAQTRDMSLSELARWILEEHVRELYYSPNQLYYNSNESYVRSDWFHDLMSRFQRCWI